MKNLLKFILVISSLFLYGLANAGILAGPDFVVKKSGLGDQTYESPLSNVGVGTQLTFRNTYILTGATFSGTADINFPTGFTYNSYSITPSNNCGIQVLNSNNSNFRYKFTFSGAVICTSEIEFTYTTNSSINIGSNQINLIEGVSIKKSFLINTTNKNTIQRAETLDLNNNGYIDAYKLTLSNSSNIASLNGLTVAGVSVGSYYSSGSSYILPFTDNVLNDGSLPQILGTFDTITILNDSINEEDKANPIVTKVNGVDLLTLGSGTLNIGTGGIVFDFSEKMLPTSTGSFNISKSGSGVAGVFSLNGTFDKATFTPSSPLTAGTYSFTSGTGAKDWSSNSNTLNYTIILLIVADSQPPVGISLSTGTGVMINAGSSITNNNLVQLTLGATDNVGVSEMIISTGATFAGASWENYSTSKNNFNIGTGSVTKTVYVKFRDLTGNESPTYSANIDYISGAVNNYINFNPVSSIYTNSTNISLSGACNYVTSTGTVISNTINFEVNNDYSGTINCSAGKTWTGSFTIQNNQNNLIKLWFDGASYAVSTIKNSINIINPMPSCTAPLNGYTLSGALYPSCNFSCNSGYTKIGGSCIANSCSATTINNSGRIYNVGYLNHNQISSDIVSSTSFPITGGVGYYKTKFTCSFGVTSQSGGETLDSVVCNSGYVASGNLCLVASSGGGSSGGGGGGGGGGGSYYYSSTSGMTSNNSTSGGGFVADRFVKYALAKTKLNDFSKVNVDYSLVKNYLDDTTQKKLLKYTNYYGNKINYENISYFVSFDNELKKQYLELLYSYKNVFEGINDYLVSKNKSYITITQNNYKRYVELSKTLNNPKTRYIVEKTKYGKIIYETKVEKLKPALKTIENKIIGKLNKLLAKKKITITQYNSAIKNYNDFVLHISIYRVFKSDLAKERGQQSLKDLLKIYNKKL